MKTLGLVVLALISMSAAPAQQKPAATYRVRITITDGEPEPASGSPVRYSEEVIGTIARDGSAPAGELIYQGRRLRRRGSGA